MVKAELAYNPYILETIIKFNGRKPKINSLVEKYSDGVLQDWISEVPSIFHDEMNGFDFEMEFSGTSTDFEELKRAFCSSGVSEKQVALFQKNELEDRDEKLQRIDNLLKWLEANPNKNFDNEKFRKENEILFEGAYNFVMVQGEQTEQPNIEWTEASVETIGEVRELNNTDLTNMPIIICVDETTLNELQQIIKYFTRRQDANHSQLFFLISDAIVGEDSIVRTIKDLGISNPQIIKMLDDESIKKYFKIYPETEYITRTISLFNKLTEDISDELEEEKASSEKENSEILIQIQLKDEDAQKIREADANITAKSNVDRPAAFVTAAKQFCDGVLAWRKKKTKITNSDEAHNLAKEFQSELEKLTEQYKEKIKTAMLETRESIDGELAKMYDAAECSDEFNTDSIDMNDENNYVYPDLTSVFMKLNVEEIVRKTGIGFFGITADSPDKEYEMQTAYYIQRWREEALSTTGSLILEIEKNAIASLTDYSEAAVSAYHKHLVQLTESKDREKAELLQKLSDEEKQLQEDMVWINNLKQQVKAIARG